MARWFAVALALLLTKTAAFAEGQGPLRFGIVPKDAPADVLAAWEPVAEALQAALGRPVVIRTEIDIPTFEACVQAGRYDIAYMNPYHYVTFSQTARYRAVAHRGDAQLKGLIIVRRDGPVQTLADLDGQRIAFPAPAAFAASLLVQSELRAAGIRFTPVYTRSHESGYLAVARDLLDAAAGVNRTYDLFLQQHPAPDDLRVIHVTQGYSPHAVAVAPWLDAGEAARVADVFASLHLTHPAALDRLGIGHFQRPAPDAYDDVRALDLAVAETGINLQENPPCRSG